MEDYRLEQSGQEVQDILNGAAMQSDLTAETERATEAEQTLQGNIDIEERDRKAADLTLQGNIDAEELRAKAAEKQNADDIDALEEKVPSGASASNKLATESYVDDSVATARATFRGTYNLVSELHLTVNATEQQIATALALAISTADNNDYCFVQVPTSPETPTEIKEIDRYKFNGTAWSFEYKLNNSGFTSAQWAAINSGITSGDVTKLAALPTNAQLTALLAGKQDVLTFDNVPTEGSSRPVKSGGVYSAIDDEKTARETADNSLSSAIEAILLLIPSAATSLNKLADKAFVNSSIATASATFRGTYNLVTDLSLTVSATHAQIATELAGAVSDEDNNDYAFVQIPTSDATPTQIAKTERYKYNGTAWEYEYDLNNSGYTAAQWAAINSGITEALVTKLSALPTNAELTSALGVLTSSITTINQKIPSAASQANQLVDTAAMESYIVQVLDVLTASFNVTSTDGHVTVSISQVDGKITSVTVSTSDIASAADLSLIAGRVTTAEGNISTNAADIANLQDAYAALTQSALVVVQPTDTWPVASPASKTIYRVVDRVNTPPQYYSDYMWNGTAMVLMATYDNAIDDVPTEGSQNLVNSQGLARAIGETLLVKTYGAYNVNNGDLVVSSTSGYDASQPIKIGDGVTNLTCSIPANCYLFYSDDPSVLTPRDVYVGYNTTGHVISGAKYVVVGFASSIPLTAGATLSFGGLANEINELKEFAKDSNTDFCQSNMYFDYSKFINASVNVEEYTYGFYTYGQAYDAEPTYHSSANRNLYKAEISVPNNGRGYWILIKGLQPANQQFRTFAIYDANGNILREGGQAGDVVFLCERSVKVLASCTAIMTCDVVTGGQQTSLYEKIGQQNALGGKTVWTLWDSLGTNTWQSKFVEISGAVFDSTLNINSAKPISAGGTHSSPQEDDGTQARAINLVSYKGTYNIDCVFIENVNDRSYLYNKGNLSDKPFMRTQKIPVQVSNLTSYSEAQTYFNQNFQTIVGGVTSESRKYGTMLYVPYASGSEIRGSKITFNSVATSEGDISITLQGSTYSVHVTTGMTIQDIKNAFLAYSYGPGWSDVDNGDNSISIFFYTQTSVRASFNGNGTGVTATVADTTGTGQYLRYYIGDDPGTDWNNTSMWSESVSLYSMYKGLIEYLKTELPSALIYWVLPYALNVDFSSDDYKRNGVWSQDLFKDSPGFQAMTELNEVQKTVCEYYGVPCLDLCKYAGMNILNIETFFYSNNVHPKQAGYDRYAEYIKKLASTF